MKFNWKAAFQVTGIFCGLGFALFSIWAALNWLDAQFGTQTALLVLGGAGLVGFFIVVGYGEGRRG